MQNYLQTYQNWAIFFYFCITINGSVAQLDRATAF